MPTPTPTSTSDFDPGIPFVAKDPNYKVSLSLQDAELDELIRTIGELTGKRFVVASAKAKGLKATIFSPEKITTVEAYHAFLAVLGSNGLTVLPDGAMLKIVDSQDATKLPTPLLHGSDATPAEERFVTRIQRLSHVGAEDVAGSVLSKFSSRDGSIVPYGPGNLLIITDTGENIRRMLKILEDVDVGGPKEQVWLEPVYYASSADIEKKLVEILDLKSGDATKGAPVASGKPAEAHVSKIVAVERPNALVIVGTDMGYRRVLELVRRIDVPSTSDGQIHVVALEHADAKKIAAALNDAVGGSNAAASAAAQGGGHPGGSALLPVLEAPVKITAEETTNSLLISSSVRDYAAIRSVIAEIDRPHRQVYIEAVVMDVSSSRDTAIGVAYHGADMTGANNTTALYGGVNPLASIGGAAAAASDPTTLQGLALGLQGPASGFTIPGLGGTGLSIPAFGVFLTMMAGTSDADILSTPHIMASDNQPAEIKVQLHTSLQKNAASFNFPGSSPGGAATPIVSSTPQYQTIGPRIKITPHINESDEVRLDVDEAISDVVGVDSGSLGTLSFNERDATTTLTVKDEQTCVIGGLMRDKVIRSEKKVPFLGDIPVLGALFRSTSETTEKANLVLILTPHIIRDPEDMRRVFERKMEERQEFLDHTGLFQSRSYAPPKDYTRAEGLLGAIRGEARRIAEKRALNDLGRPREALVHDGVLPVDLPSEPPIRGADHAAPPLPRVASPPVEKIER